MTFNPNRPIATEDLSDSQPLIQGNFSSSDISFGIDHYRFSDLTANNGFHNKVTTPGYIASPPTGLPPVTTTNPIFYGYKEPQAGSPLPIGVIQYSRGVTNAVPTPVTSLHSTAAAISLGAGSTTDIVDFTLITVCIFNIYIFVSSDPTVNLSETVFWNGTASSAAGNVFFGLVFSGKKLQIQNLTSGTISIYWTVEFERIQ